MSKHQLGDGRIALIPLFVVAFVAAAQAQSGGGAGTSGSRGVSRSTVAAIWSHEAPDHTLVLELLVLMRGSPGWYTASGPGRNGFNFSIAGAHSTNHTFATTGGLTVALDSDSSSPNKKLTVTATLTTVFDQLLAPDSFNVVLVDGADTTTPIVQTELVDVRLEGEGDALTRAIRNTPDLLNFIQCDVAPTPLPADADARMRLVQTMSLSFCRQLR
jgi:hypothetical protein